MPTIKELKMKLEECMKMCGEMEGSESESPETESEMEVKPAKDLSMLKAMAAKKLLPTK